MADHLQLTADDRTETGNGPTRRLRREGRVPGVVYHAGREATAFSVPARELRRVMSDGGRTSVIDISVGEAGTRPVVFKEWQIHPVRGNVLHIDFQEVDLTVAIEVSVGIVLVGSAVGVREGGILDQPLRDVTVSALPDSIPDSLEFDVSELDVGDTVMVADLEAPEGVEITGDDDIVVASVVLPRAAVEEEVDAELEDGELEEGEEPAEGDEAAGDEGAGDDEDASSGE
ncbi:MAG: 50S ribosomal protein L25 [Miltoncostaeaceae bacterium]